MFSAVDPYPEMAQLRARGSIVPYRDGDRPSYFVAGWNEVLRVLRDVTTFSTDFSLEALDPLVGSSSLLEDQSADRAAQRRLAASFFSERALRARFLDAISELAWEYCRPIVCRGHGDLWSELAVPLPEAVLCQVMGLEADGSQQLRIWIHDTLTAARAMTARSADDAWVHEHIARLLRERRRSPGPGFISELAQLPHDRPGEVDSAVATVKLMLTAGVETVQCSIGNLLFAVLTHPDQLEAVRTNELARSAAIEESLRWQAPVILTVRTAVRPSILGGVPIPRGSSLYVLLASANRDERRFLQPDDYLLDRQDGAHVSFGYGLHACVGAGLARLEHAVVLRTLLDVAPELQLTASAGTPQITGEVFRSPQQLPVVC